jgi:hypothetical protein
MTRRSPWLPVAILAAAGALALLGCAHVRVEAETAPGAEPSRYATYVQTLPPEGEPRSLGQGKLVGDHVEAEVAKVLAAKGYEEADGDPADMVVTFQVSAAWSVRMRDAGQPDANYEIPQQYLKGEIRFDVYRGEDMEPLWHGVGEMDISKGTDPKWAASQVVKAVLSRFPDRAGAPD